MSKDYDKIKYRFPNLENKGREITFLYGGDTEAYTNGRPFLLTFSNGVIYHEKSLHSPDFFENLFSSFMGCDIAVFNLKYDSGAILYSLPKDQKIELWEKTSCKYGRLKIEYIPHKALILSHGKERVRFWDIAQYFHQSLNSAALKYLGEKKLDIETKEFTQKYVSENLDRIVKYCLRDSELTSSLGNFLLKKFTDFGMRVTALYSGASLSFRYFSDNAKIITSWRFWKYYPEVLKYALDSYEGGKFEITARGSFYGYEYDLCSAYPYEIRNLVDISTAQIEFTKTYQKEAIYGLLHVRIKNNGNHVPFGIMKNNVRIYPSGEYFLTITKQEYDYVKDFMDFDISIISGAWLFVDSIRYPYRKCIDRLFELKSYYKDKDAALYMTCKIIANSFYGKMCQVIENWKGQYIAGIGWNPLYASVITANTRIRVTKLQNEMKEKCLAVHTDSVITTEPIRKELITGKLGEYDFVTSGNGILIACGQYELSDESAFKGFEPLTDETWRKILERNRNKSVIDYPVLKVESWIEAMSKGHYDKINLFIKEIKKININADTKRVWLKKARCADLLDGIEQSLPAVVSDTKKPEGW